MSHHELHTPDDDELVVEPDPTREEMDAAAQTALDMAEEQRCAERAERRADLDDDRLDNDSRWLANDHDVRSHR